MSLKSTYLILLNLCISTVLLFCFFSCEDPKKNSEIVLLEAKTSQNQTKEIVVGANRMDHYLPKLKNKRIAVVANQTSVVSNNDGFVHLVDTLIARGVKIEKVFAPEHGFRGEADAGEHVSNDIDQKTGVPLISLYGKNKKPSSKALNNVDVVVFDIQDVGVRFYTYISTLTYVMEACAEKGIELVVLDRPNPNGHYVDGPTLEPKHSSFVGMHPIPLVYGMTIGEYAKMVNGEGWLKGNLSCKIEVVELLNYSHQSSYSLPIRPSPNLPNDQSINLYPSLGFFEGTIINAGRGTDFQFQRYGAPFFPKTEFSYVPQPNFGSKNPKFKGELCYGVDLGKAANLSVVNIEWLLDAYNKTPNKEDFFGDSFTIHAGTERLRNQIEKGLSAEEIQASWQPEVKKFKKTREKYLIYKD